ncbi:MAG TPA: phospholipase D-like domain-containing protein [Bacteroidia bacterium]|nr:phospholipase D-like domain-containing protein [Bacteroidia bacterium]HNS12440.1 phospholipase D-like domain-containing protein [Bacteroidia bacterium]
MSKKRRSEDLYLKKNLVTLIQSGEEFMHTCEELIAKAETEIHLQSYILEPDETGKRIIDALKLASEFRKVKVFILVDAYGSQNLGPAIRKELKDSGIQIKRFGKLYSRGSFHIGRRLHRKVLVADGKTALVGGINISNKYTEQNNSPAWLDFALKVQGEAARKLLHICRMRWKKSGIKAFPEKLRSPIDAEISNYNSGVTVKVSQNDYINRKNEIAKSYRREISSAQHTITIVGGYFLPGGRMRRILKDAAVRGVEIKIIVSYYSDVRLVYLARRYLYTWMLRNKMKIYEYKLSNVHGKVLIADNKFVSLGSYDLNNLSTYSNIELNIEITDETFAGHVNSRLEEIMSKDCILVTEQNFRARLNPFSLFLSWLSYQLVKTLFVLSVLLAKKSE